MGPNFSRIATFVELTAHAIPPMPIHPEIVSPVTTGLEVAPETLYVDPAQVLVDGMYMAAAQQPRPGQGGGNRKGGGGGPVPPKGGGGPKGGSGRPGGNTGGTGTGRRR